MAEPFPQFGHDPEGYTPEAVAEAAHNHRLQHLIIALRESEERYHSLFESSRDAIYITRRDGHFVDVNQSLLDLFGYTRAELLSLNAQVLYTDPGDRSRFQRVIEQYRSVRDFAVRLRTRDGRILECLLSSSIRYAEDGSILSYQGIIHDTTERNRALRALEHSEHFTRTIISSVGEGIVVFDRSLRFQIWNHVMEELTGLAADEVIGRQATEVFPELPERGINHLLTRALMGFQVKSQDTPYHIPRTGKTGWFVGQYSPHISPDGKVVGVVGVVHDITERKRTEQQLVHNAFHDGLTGLPNRALFSDRLERLIAAARRNNTHRFGVLFLDLDRFKVINDSLGHLRGDQLLVSIARRLEACVRQGDTVARLGGDEFAILLGEIADLAEATRIADRVQQDLSLPFQLDVHEVFTSCSIGIAVSTPAYTRPEEILRDADTAMYRAKNTGRARYEVFDREMHSEALAQLELETDLRRAIERNELTLHYQPIVDLEDGSLTGFEALVRWQHPRHGIMLPAEFIGLAEETGLIVPLGCWVLREACAQMRAWEKETTRVQHLAISVNLSARQFLQPDLLEQIAGVLAQTGFPASRLKLEITESVLMQNASTVSQMLAELRARGVKLCIDDFGTGYSSLSYLQSFPIDSLKIDRSFISAIDDESSSLELIETIVALSRILGMEAVAEGVESREQLEAVRRLGSRFAQGYHFSHPLPASEALCLVRDQRSWPI